MKITYQYYDPTGNITLLVETSVPRQKQAAVAAELMRRHPEAEQVGFLEAPASPAARLRLQMMGGEFCGNATMSAAVYLTEHDGTPSTAVFSSDVPLEVSGADGVLICHVERSGAHIRGTVSMPLPERICSAFLPPWESGNSQTVPAVRFPGIVHCIVPANLMSREQVEQQIRPHFAKLCEALHTEACGVLLYEEASSAFTPLVYVAATDTAVWESGCGSGSAAIGAYAAWQAAGEQRGRTVHAASLRQPGGTIQVQAVLEDRCFQSLSITGEVRGRGGGQEVLLL